jgi:hypothetical protein
MKYIAVRTYGNGKHMNKVHPVIFDWLSQAERACAQFNEYDSEGTSEKWIPMPLTTYKGKVF